MDRERQEMLAAIRNATIAGGGMAVVQTAPRDVLISQKPQKDTQFLGGILVLIIELFGIKLAHNYEVGMIGTDSCISITKGEGNVNLRSLEYDEACFGINPPSKSDPGLN